MRILQIIHDRQPGGVQKLADMIEAGLAPRRFAVETVYLYPRAGLPVSGKIAGVLRTISRIWRGDYDVLIAYQSTASVLVGIVGWLAGCRLRVVHQTSMPRETPRLLRLLDMLVGLAWPLQRQYRQQRGHLVRVCALPRALPAFDDSDRARPRCSGADTQSRGRAPGYSICRRRSQSSSVWGGSRCRRTRMC